MLLQHGGGGPIASSSLHIAGHLPSTSLDKGELENQDLRQYTAQAWPRHWPNNLSGSDQSEPQVSWDRKSPIPWVPQKR